MTTGRSSCGDASFRSANARGASGGFTLVEVLIALVITSLLVSILIGALYYVFRVQDLLRDEVVEREAALRARAWFAEAVEGCLPLARDADSAFKGSPQEIGCESTAPLEPRRIRIPLRIVFLLRREAGGVTQLIYREQGQASADPRVLFSWPGGDIQFAFVDGKGQPLDRWPAEQWGDKDYQALPAAVRIVIKDRDHPDVRDWVVAPGADGWLPPQVKLPFGMKTP